ncbi:WecB/TagA/CpsF family glycosyltransferase [Spirulina sp. CS-785/01]|uniref:WecB/TagA/CpsF family glycosyltransferase n=1 Tax=Spirulina sp. CS-785/01 TaxID=3021716 RepID=UPI002330F52B|nr:WecB/TagA/CpsF family glycosyltransferase [Spirulina sp. CS-785/01]MDB9315469.1 WecB/TagA/CpsF family glycosyltransferase [Spirulina sp. CS-785/01]
MLVSVPTQSVVLQLPIHLCEDYVSWLRSRLEQKQGTHVVTLNSEMAMLAERNPPLTQVIKNAELVIPDGAGVIFYLRLRKQQQQQRCPGIELAGSLIETVAQDSNPLPMVFYGGQPGVTEKAAAHWQSRYPHLTITPYHGYLDDQEQGDFKAFLQDTQPPLILVGLGVPRQEFWIAEHRSLCPQSVWIGVGGSFDIWAGVKSRAPAWLQNYHLEWLYRLYQEPWRWRRMLVLPQFAWRALVG